jgi:hypothetical protein
MSFGSDATPPAPRRFLPPPRLPKLLDKAPVKATPAPGTKTPSKIQNYSNTVRGRGTPAAAPKPNNDFVLPTPPVQPKLAPLPPVPKPKEILDFIDEISGVKFTKGRGPDGKESFVKQKLPRTPEEEAFWKKGAELFDQSIKGILELEKYDPKKVVPFKPYIDVIANLGKERIKDLQGVFQFQNVDREINDLRQIQKRYLDEDIIRNRHQMEHDLNQRGLDRSEYGNAQRDRLQREINSARQESELRAREYGRGLQQEQLGQNMAGYNLREEARRAQLGNAQTEYGLAQQQLADLEARRQSALNERYNQFKLGAQLRGEDANKALMTRAPELALNQQNLMNAQQLDAYNIQNRNALLQHEAEIGRLNTGYGQQVDRTNTGYNNAFNRAQTKYQNRFNQTNAQNQQDLLKFELEQKYREPTFGEVLGQTLGSAGGMAAGSMLMGPTGSGGAMLATRLFG